MNVYEKYGICPWRITETMETDEDVRLLLEECAEDDELLLFVLGKMAKEMGMTELSRATGISREHLYRALAPNGNPSMKTLRAVLDALGLRLRVERKPDYVPAQAIPLARKKGNALLEKESKQKPTLPDQLMAMPHSDKEADFEKELFPGTSSLKMREVAF